jgi:hypothetical protein
MRSLMRMAHVGATIGCLATLALAGCARGSMEMESRGDVVPLSSSAAAIAASWSSKHAETANMLIGKYGNPDVVSDHAMIWINKGPFVRTVLWRSAVAHDFPMPHEDYLTQTVMHRVPADKLDELWEYDGSVWAHRTRGELSAQCDMEPFNLLALNLAHDVMTNRRSVADARAFYAKTVMAYKNGDRSSPYTSRLMFPTEPGAADRDVPQKM